ncbi:MAG: ribosome silencing factor [Aridibacter sp.]
METQVEITKNKSLEREEAVKNDTLELIIQTTPFEEVDDEIKLALHLASEKKAVDTVVLDLREITSFTEFFVITSGTNQRQVQAIADEISEQLKKQMKFKAIRIEGYSTADWVLLDYGDFIVHIFNQKSREFYDLERLWRDAKKVELHADITSNES